LLKTSPDHLGSPSYGRAAEEHLSGFKEAGASKAIFHFEAADPETVIAAARKLDMAVGLAVNPETPVSAVSPLPDKIDSLLYYPYTRDSMGPVLSLKYWIKLLSYAEFRRISG
jgi:hypothetical protein